MDTSLFYNPIVTPGVIAAIASLAVLVLLWWTRKGIVTMVSQVRQRCFTRTGFFWTVNLVFMAVSVVQGGVFFGIAGKGIMLYLGFAVSFFLDLVTVILMQAMLESRYRGEDGRARQFLFFICVTCGTSTFANLAISLNDFDAAKMLPNTPWWVQAAAPYVLASFPLFVIMMSIAAEMIINLRPLERLQEEEYEADEKKRVRILEIRNTYLEIQATEELRALQIKATMKANKAAHRAPMAFQLPWVNKGSTIDIDALKTELTSQLKEDYNARLTAMQSQLEQALNPPEGDVNSIFKRPLSITEYRLKEGFDVDGSGALKSDVANEAGIYASPIINATAMAPQATPDNDASPVKTELKTAENVAKQWHDASIKSLSLDDIIRDTKLSAQKVRAAKHRFSRVGRNGGLYRTSSVVIWLKEVL